MKKRKQHYVWKYYLRPWTTNGKIFCLQDGRIFQSKLEGVANKRDFYMLKQLTIDEINLIYNLAIKPTALHLQKINNDWINKFQFVYVLKRFLEKHNLYNQEIENELEKHIINFEEDFHSHVEGFSIKYIDNILKKDISFLDKEEEYIDFLYFLSIQYMRTKKIKENVTNDVRDNCHVNVESIWNILSHIFATNLSWGLYSNRKKLHMILLENCSSIELITGDQPVVNTFAIINRVVDTLELYYPVSPKIAILISEKPNLNQLSRLLLNCEQVEYFNMHIMKNSLEQVYGSSFEVLEKLI